MFWHNFALNFDFSTAFWIGVVVLNAYTILRALTRGHGVEGTLAWVCAILAFPAVGAGAYLLLGNPRVQRTRRRKRQSAAAVRHALTAVGRDASHEEASPLLDTQGSILKLATSLTGLAPSEGNRVKLLMENRDSFEEIETGLREAKRSIWAECYIIRNDETGKRFLDLLAKRAAEGIEVRLLYDAFGSFNLDSKRLKAIRSAGGLVEEFLPMNPLRRKWAIHLRNHRKLIVVDGALGFTGGANVGDEYSGLVRLRQPKVENFRDTHLSIEGPAVGDLAQIFAEDWTFATDEQLTPPDPPEPVPGGSSIVSVLPSGPDQVHNANGLVYFAGITSARERCYLTSPYFIPDDPTIRALLTAAMRGVDVRLLVPGKADVPLVRSAARSNYYRLIQAGIRVYEYLPSMLHAKTMVVDGTWGVVGSANVDMRSFRLNFELGALVLDGRFAEELEERFMTDLEDSRQITSLALSNRTAFERLKESMARLLSPLL